METAKKIGSFLKIEHTLFSLPLLLAGALLAPKISLKTLPWDKLAWVLAAGIGARTAALCLNRILDREIDARNPRTKARELPTGALSLKQALGVTFFGLLLYLFSAYQLGPLCLKLSPLPLLVFVGYPLMKRFTYFAHFGVGAGLALAPLGGFIGVTGAWPETLGIWYLCGFTLCWVTGFDALYAILDEAFDKREGLRSIPADFGPPTAQDFSLLMHALAFFCLAMMRWNTFADQGSWIWLALVPAGILLSLEQKYGYSLEANSAFFKVNAWVGLAVLVYVVAGVS